LVDEAALAQAHADAQADGMEERGVSRWRSPVGCPACSQTGFSGRVGLYEMMDVGPALQHGIAQGRSVAELERMVNDAGRRSLAQEGLLKAMQNLTTMDEVYRATGAGGAA
jgi:general secretion pathway protein E